MHESGRYEDASYIPESNLDKRRRVIASADPRHDDIGGDGGGSRTHHDQAQRHVKVNIISRPNNALHDGKKDRRRDEEAEALYDDVQLDAFCMLE